MSTLLNPDPDALAIARETAAFLRTCPEPAAQRKAAKLEFFALAVFLRDEILAYGVNYHVRRIAEKNGRSIADLWRARTFGPDSRWRSSTSSPSSATASSIPPASCPLPRRAA